MIGARRKPQLRDRGADQRLAGRIQTTKLPHLASAQVRIGEDYGSPLETHELT